MTGDLRAAIEMLRPHLAPDAPLNAALQAIRSTMIVWCDAVDAAERRRQRFEDRVAAKIAEFENTLVERSERNLRIRGIRRAVIELREVVADTRLRAGIPERVYEVEFADMREPR